MSLDYIPEPAAGTSTLEVMADVHQRFDDVNSGEVEVLESTQEGNQATLLRNACVRLHVVYRSTFK